MGTANVVGVRCGRQWPFAKHNKVAALYVKLACPCGLVLGPACLEDFDIQVHLSGLAGTFAHHQLPSETSRLHNACMHPRHHGWGMLEQNCPRRVKPC